MKKVLLLVVGLFLVCGVCTNLVTHKTGGSIADTAVTTTTEPTVLTKPTEPCGSQGPWNVCVTGVKTWKNGDTIMKLVKVKASHSSPRIELTSSQDFALVDASGNHYTEPSDFDTDYNLTQKGFRLYQTENVQPRFYYEGWLWFVIPSDTDGEVYLEAHPKMFSTDQPARLALPKEPEAIKKAAKAQD